VQPASSPRRHARLSTIVLLCFACTAAYGTDTYVSSSNRLSIPLVTIGSATYSNMVVTVGNIVSGPTCPAPRGNGDIYSPANNWLTIPSVMVGTSAHSNVIVTVGHLVSVGSVTGADSYDGAHLTIGSVEVQGTRYSDAIITINGVVSVAGGMPGLARDTYDPATKHLSIPAVTAGGRVYTNVVVTVGNLVSVKGSSRGATETIVHAFYSGPGSPDGYQPEAALIQGSDGNFYGTTTSSGDYRGVVFQITPSGSETVLHQFLGLSDGANPYASVIQAHDGNLYGTTNRGGSQGAGTVFKITPSESSESVLYSFAAGQDGIDPQGLIEGCDGNFYGTTNSGGANGLGTVFRVTPLGAETVLYSFAGGTTDGSFPAAGLVEARDGFFYGTTQKGGANDQGTVFRVSFNGVENVLYTFTGGIDGGAPSASVIQASDGNLYGTTFSGGAGALGTVFSIAPGGSARVLFDFAGGTYGGSPKAGVIQAGDGNFYGTTSLSGTYGKGTVFRITPSGTASMLYSFAGGSDGAFPWDNLIQASDGNFYGTTTIGGNGNSSGYGTVFMITP
jgi:uncharacterized repeat protein (TIGR03803 family)